MYIMERKKEYVFKGPLFVIGLGRSGTSYLTRLINKVPDTKIALDYELIPYAYGMFKKKDVLTSRSNFDKYMNCLKKKDITKDGYIRNGIFYQPSEYYDSLYQRLKQHRDFNKFIEVLYLNQSNRRIGRYRLEKPVKVKTGECSQVIWGDKMCDHLQIPLLSQLFPRARYIFIVRDIRAVVASNKIFSNVNFYTTSFSWVETTRFLQKFQKEKGEQTALLFRYEDLVANPETVLKQVYHLIERSVPSGFSDLEKPRFDSLDKWRVQLGHSEVRRVEEICYDQMKELGYKPELAQNGKKIGRMLYMIYMLQHSYGLLMSGRRKASDVLSFQKLLKYLRFYLQR